MKFRSVDGSYYQGYTKDEHGFNQPIARSAFQRKEILEGETYMKDGVEYARWKVIGHWTDYEKAKAEVEAFNRKQEDEDISSR